MQILLRQHPELAWHAAHPEVAPDTIQLGQRLQGAAH